MLKDITLGQFYPADSILHKLDPRVKLFGTLIYVVSLFVFQGFVSFLLVFFALACIILISRVPVRLMLKGIRGIWALLAITAFFNLFFAQGNLIWGYGFIHITQEGIHNAVFYCVRLILIVTGSSVMTLTTTPSALTDGMEKALRPLEKIGMPVYEVAMMMSIALRFIPILAEEADKIKKAQMARGAEFDEGNLLKRAFSLLPIIIPLFISAFRRAADLALAMEARCYRGGEGRTKMNPLQYQVRDCRAYTLVLLYLAAVIVLRIFNL